jgi:hypothetical protein
MKLIDSIDALKERSTLINNSNIDYQHLQRITTQVLNHTGEVTPEFEELCRTLNILCSRVENSMVTLRNMIPIKGSVNEVQTD